MKAHDYFRDWLNGEECFLKRSTWQATNFILKLHIYPYFDGYELEDITPRLCQSYVNEKLKHGRTDGKGGLSVVTVHKHLTILKKALGEAVRLGLISQSPAQYVRMPRRKSIYTPRAVFYTAEEGKAVLKAFEDSPLYLLVAIALYYGLRRSEVVGLRWQAVDFENDILRIEHTIVRAITIEASDCTKTSTSRRAFQLLPEIKELLLEYEKTAPISDYIFCNQDGSPLNPDGVTQRFKRVLKKHGLKDMRFHDLRHSTASILFDKGWQLEDVKNWLGHADIETTSNIYLHYTRARKVLLAQDLEGMLIAKKKSTY